MYVRPEIISITRNLKPNIITDRNEIYSKKLCR